MLGPVLERLNDERLNPLIDRTFSIMARKNLPAASGRPAGCRRALSTSRRWRRRRNLLAIQPVIHRRLHWSAGTGQARKRWTNSTWIKPLMHSRRCPVPRR
ncbi:portal protein [Klebsiella pneumoniae]|nr:portal protein [Klebsiella pneumoniae]